MTNQTDDCYSSSEENLNCIFIILSGKDILFLELLPTVYKFQDQRLHWSTMLYIQSSKITTCHGSRRVSPYNKVPYSCVPLTQVSTVREVP